MITTWNKYPTRLLPKMVLDPLAKLFEQGDLERFPNPPRNQLLYTDWRLIKRATLLQPALYV